MITLNNDNKIKVFSAMNIFNELLRNGVIQQKIHDKAMPFDERFTNISNHDLAALINDNFEKFNTEIKFFYPKWYQAKPYAKIGPYDYDEFSLNGNLLNRPMPNIAGTIAHEWTHAINHFVKKFISQDIRFDHGLYSKDGRSFNSLAGKDNSFPVWIGRQVKLMAEDVHNNLMKGNKNEKPAKQSKAKTKKNTK